ncbi:hypothetical protein RDE2_24650 [Rhodococcus sp. RDE2]|nr:hypothetical protein RDE2_24650 [Rhodococcus sp. RDE2]
MLTALLCLSGSSDTSQAVGCSPDETHVTRRSVSGSVEPYATDADYGVRTAKHMKELSRVDAR